MSVIRVNNAHKEYRSASDSKKVMEGFGMSVAQGTIYALMGSSGCGKTTLISCLVGINSLDSGDIEIFNDPPRSHRSRIGYMPQENALIAEFTIREMIWFFGTIFGLSRKKIKERIKFLTDLLELPDGDKLIRECSGGQQRRVSFAITLVHEPELLILDEPTVGLDPLLRVKIWDYLLDITMKNQVTVLLSTHYIEEARQSTHIGLMRNGFLIAEDSPQKILRSTQASNMEEAFLILSKMQENNLTSQNNGSKIIQHIIDVTSNEDLLSKQLFKGRKTETVAQQTTLGILFALLTKNFLQIFRNIDILIVSSLIPVIGCICLHYAIGGKIKDLTLGIVNEEVMSREVCLNSSLRTFEITNSWCSINKVSCRFIEAIEADNVKKKFYSKLSDAVEDTKKAKIVGFLRFASNFTETLPFINGDSSDFTDDGLVQVYLDETDIQKTFFIKQLIYDSYQNFAEKIMTDCKLSKKAGSRPIVFLSSFGELNFDLRRTLIPGCVISAFFTISSYILTISITYDRTEGTWNRSLVAGAKPSHFVLSHFIEGIIVMVIQFIEYLIYSTYFLQPSLSVDASLVLSVLLFLTGVSGISYGLLCSIIFDSTLGAMIVSQIFVYPIIFISGTLWPIDASPFFLRTIGYLFPYALPTIAFRNILNKNVGFCDQSVYLAIMILSAWIFASLALSFWLVREKHASKIERESIKM